LVYLPVEKLFYPVNILQVDINIGGSENKEIAGKGVDQNKPVFHPQLLLSSHQLPLLENRNIAHCSYNTQLKHGYFFLLFYYLFTMLSLF